MKIWGMAAAGMSLALVSSAIGKTGDDPLLKPIAPDYARRWLDPHPPVRIYGNSYLVGFRGLNVGLIKTSAGLILIDGAVPQAVRTVEANIRRLGFQPRDIKYILSTEPHYDHAGGLAALARDTGATVLSSATAAEELKTSHAAANDPQATILEPFPGVARVRAVADGEKIRLGNTVVTAVATPGHTSGSMSWTWRSCEGKRCLNIVFAASTNPTAPDDYRFSDHRAIVEAYAPTFRRLRTMPCDILITAHPQQSGGEVKLDKLLARHKSNPFIDAKACQAYADEHEALLMRRLRKERGGF